MRTASGEFTVNQKVRTLCADDFNHGDPVIWTPSAQVTPIILPPSFSLSGKCDPQKIREGEPCFPTGMFAAPNDFRLEEDFPNGQVLLVIKKPGSLIHTLPKELAGLAPTLKKISDIQTQVNADTMNRIGCLIVRTDNINPGLILTDSDWHQDFVVPKYKPDVLSLWEGSGFSLRQTFAAKSVSLSKLANIYHISNISAGWFQSKALPRKFCSEKRGPLDLAMYFSFFSDSVYKSSPYEVVMGNSHVYHRAAPTATTGRRVYAQLAYLDCR